MSEAPWKKTSKQLERHLKGVSNHHRIDILRLIERRRQISLDDIARILHCNLKTTAEHTRRLALAGLVYKRYRGRIVIHTLSPYGKTIHNFLKTFSYS